MSHARSGGGTSSAAPRQVRTSQVSIDSSRATVPMIQNRVPRSSVRIVPRGSGTRRSTVVRMAAVSQAMIRTRIQRSCGSASTIVAPSALSARTVSSRLRLHRRMGSAPIGSGSWSTSTRNRAWIPSWMARRSASQRGRSAEGAPSASSSQSARASKRRPVARSFARKVIRASRSIAAAASAACASSRARATRRAATPSRASSSRRRASGTRSSGPACASRRATAPSGSPVRMARARSSAITASTLWWELPRAPATRSRRASSSRRAEPFSRRLRSAGGRSR